MPKKYIIEMVCDWRSFSRKWGRKVKASTLNLSDKIVVHPDTKNELEILMTREVPSKELNHSAHGETIAK
jgi:hypothetical protein